MADATREFRRIPSWGGMRTIDGEAAVRWAENEL